MPYEQPDHNIEPNSATVDSHPEHLFDTAEFVRALREAVDHYTKEIVSGGHRIPTKELEEIFRVQTDGVHTLRMSDRYVHEEGLDWLRTTDTIVKSLTSEPAAQTDVS